jgi:FAD/FMN-containing dehydrogenase
MQELAYRRSKGHAGHEVLAFPGEDLHETARGSFNLAVDQRPNVIALPRNVEDVIAVVRMAADLELTVAPQPTGHGASSLPFLEHAMLIRTDRLREVELDARRRRARVAAGVRWQDLVPRPSEHDLAALHGTARDVGVVGYTLRGGLSRYARRHGLAVNHVTSVELVTADGQLRRVDHEHEPEPFWALRGGGADFGVVTTIEFGLIPAPELFAGALFFPLCRADQVLHAWRSWLASAPDELMSIGRILSFPPLPEIPEPLRAELHDAGVPANPVLPGPGARPATADPRPGGSPRPIHRQALDLSAPEV